MGNGSPAGCVVATPQTSTAVQEQTPHPASDPGLDYSIWLKFKNSSIGGGGGGNGAAPGSGERV